MAENKRAVQLPADLCQAVEDRYRGRFANVEELLNFVLQELARDDAKRMDEAEQRMLENRLKDLGYL